MNRWLSDTMTPSFQRRSLSLMNFNAHTDGPLDTSLGRAMSFNASKDITSLGSSGYLHHHSFDERSTKANASEILTLESISNAGSTPSSECSTIILEPSAHEQGRVEVRHFVHRPCSSHSTITLEHPASDQLAAGSTPSSECSTTLLEHPAHEQGQVEVRQFVDPPCSSHTPLPSQFELARIKLKGYVVTETPSLGDSGNEDDRNSTAGSEKKSSRFISHEGASSSRSDATANFTAEPSGESGVEQDAAREAYHMYTLARLEGRVPPISSSPIQRDVNPEWRYNDDVEMEHSGPVLRCPRPLRQADRVGMGQLFQLGAVDESDGLEELLQRTLRF